MKPVYKELVILFVCLIFGFLISRIVLHYVPKPEGKYIDCSLAEISPDFTVEMKKACREINKR